MGTRLLSTALLLAAFIRLAAARTLQLGRRGMDGRLFRCRNGFLHVHRAQGDLWRGERSVGRRVRRL